MAFIYDNMVSVLVAMTVTLILASVQLRATRHQAAGMASYAMTQRATQLSSWLQNDLARIGKNRQGSGVPIDTIIAPADDSTARWLTERFVFKRDSIIPSGGTVPIRVRYDIQSAGTRTVGGETRDVYRLDRERKVGTGPWVPAGGSVGGLQYFDVDLLNKNADPIENPLMHLQAHADTVRCVRVRFSVLPPFENDQILGPASRTNTVVARYHPAEL
jgi:hypothetical protein